MVAAAVVNVGTQANDATGDLLRDAFTKINTNFAALFAGNFPAAQLTVGPPVSGNALTAVGISGSAAIVATAFSVTDISLTATGTASFAGGVTFGSPTGGNKGAGSFNAASGFINNVAVLTVAVTSLTGTASQITASASTGAVTLSFPQNVIIPQPASGTSLIVNGVGSNPTTSFQAASGQTGRIDIIDGTGVGRFSLRVSQTTNGDFQLRDEINAATRIVVSPTGATVFNAPTSGDTITTTNVAGANALTLVGNSAGTAVLRLNTQATTGAQTATFAANNKPGSGTTGPDKWIPVNLDGTTHYVPAFL